MSLKNKQSIKPIKKKEPKKKEAKPKKRVAAGANSFGRVLGLVAVISIVGLIVGVFAANYAFMQVLKIPSEFFGYRIALDYTALYPDSEKVKQAGQVALGVLIGMPVLLNAIALIALFAGRGVKIYGEARFATPFEIKQAGFKPTAKETQALKESRQGKCSQPAILIGKHKGELLKFTGNEFAYVSAPTRAGKGVSFVIPNLLTYPDSVVVLDVKNENWDITAGFRSKYMECHLFSPSALDGRSSCWNPLDYIDRDETKRIAGIQTIGDILYDTSNDKEAFWNNNAQKLFQGLILMLLESPGRPVSIPEMLRVFSPISGLPFHEWFIEESNRRNGNSMDSDEPPFTPECLSQLMSYCTGDDKLRENVKSTLLAPLSVFSDPMVAACTSSSTFRLDEVRKKKMSIYIGIKPNELGKYRAMLNLFFSQLISLNTTELPEANPELKYQCLMMLDEFTAMGKVGIVSKSVAYIAGYNMRAALIFQNKSQAEEVYGREGAKTLVSNMAVQIAYTPATIDDAKEYSEGLGIYTMTGKSRSVQSKGGSSTNRSDQKRELMLPQELREMPFEEQIIFRKGTKPIKCEKIIYFEDPYFMSRANLPLNPRFLPPKQDVLAMLDSMRGIERKPMSVAKAKSVNIDQYLKQDKAFMSNFDVKFGFEPEFIDLFKAEMV